MEAEVGVEPTQTGPRPAVLPLDDSAIKRLNYFTVFKLDAVAGVEPATQGLQSCALPLDHTALVGGRCRIRTHGSFTPYCFQDSRHKPDSANLP